MQGKVIKLRRKKEKKKITDTKPNIFYLAKRIVQE
jgi:hypothetical protein